MNHIPDQNDFGDFVQTFQIEDLNIRGRLIRLDQAYNQAIHAHGYPPAINNLIGETMVLAAILASALKYDGVFTLQVQGDGPVSLIMADITSDGGMRAYAKFKDGVTEDDIAGASIPQTLGAGHMAFTVDQGPDTDRYQGIVALEGNTIAECAQSYFQQSEQLDTAIMVAAQPVADDFPPRAAIIMIQKMPGEDRLILTADEEEENWRNATILLNSLTSEELLDPRLSFDELLYRLFHEETPRVYDPQKVAFGCTCSAERVKAALEQYSSEDISHMITDDGKVTADCQFCGALYVFDPEEVGSGQ